MECHLVRALVRDLEETEVARNTRVEAAAERVAVAVAAERVDLEGLDHRRIDIRKSPDLDPNLRINNFILKEKDMMNHLEMEEVEVEDTVEADPNLEIRDPNVQSRSPNRETLDTTDPKKEDLLDLGQDPRTKEDLNWDVFGMVLDAMTIVITR